MTALITITPREDGQLWTTSLGTSGTYSVGDVARVLGTGQNRLFKFLKARGILRSDRTPRREYLRLGYFRIVRGEYQRADGIVCEYARLPKFILQKETSFAIFVLLSREIMMHWNTTPKTSIHDEAGMRDILVWAGEKPYRLAQIYAEFYKNNKTDFSEYTTIPLWLRSALSEHVDTQSLSVETIQTSDDDQTTKILFATTDDKKIESVIMRHLSGRTTLCVSCQAGCPMACVFCATGKLGLEKNLSAWEILDQVAFAKEVLREEGRELRNIVFMGMGEPFLNYANVSSAIRILTDQKKWDFSSRRVTVSTCGIVPKIREIARDFPQVSLAISLHAPDDETRRAIMPVNHTYPVADLMDSLDEYVQMTNKRVFYEYIMIAGVTDRLELAPMLAELLRGRLAHVNFIPYNPGEGIMGRGHRPSSRLIIEKFQRTLERAGVPSTVRHTMGDDIAAACGQLARKETMSRTLA